MQLLKSITTEIIEALKLKRSSVRGLLIAGQVKKAVALSQSKIED